MESISYDLFDRDDVHYLNMNEIWGGINWLSHSMNSVQTKAIELGGDVNENDR